MATLMAIAPASRCSSAAQASDQWAYYQAKSASRNASVVDMLGVLTPGEMEKAGALRAKYQRESIAYEKDKDQISDRPRFESERALVSRRENASTPAK